MTPFAQLCLLVRCALGTEPDPARAIGMQDLDGEAVAVLAFQHRIAAFLRRLAVDSEIGPLLPAELRAGFIVAYEANRDRNLALQAQLAEIAQILNARAIEPVLLKGAGRLLDGVYADPAERFLLDFDLLVPWHRVGHASRALVEAGYAFSEREARLSQEFHHLPSLWREDTLARIELHRTAVSHWHDRLLSTDSIHENATRFDLGGSRVRLPTPADGLMHLVVHGQLQHHRLLVGGVLLSEVVELALLRRRYGDGLVDRAFELARRREFGTGFASFLHICEIVTGESIGQAKDRPLLAQPLARRALWQQEHRRMRAPGRFLVWITGGALVLRRQPSVRGRFPGRLAERSFYTNRWRDLRRVFSR